MTVQHEVPHWTTDLFDGISTFTGTDQFVYLLGVLLLINFITTFIQLIRWFLSPQTIVSRIVCLVVGFSVWKDYFKQKHEFIIKAADDCGYGTLLYSLFTFKGFKCPAKSATELHQQFDVQFIPIDFLVNFCIERIIQPMSKISTLLTGSFNELLESTWLGWLVAKLSNPFVAIFSYFIGFFIVWKLVVFACHYLSARNRANSNSRSKQPKVKKSNVQNGNSIGGVVGGIASSIAQFGMNVFSTSSSALGLIKYFNFVIPWYIQWIVVAVCIFASFFLSTLTWFAKSVTEVIEDDLTVNDGQDEEEVESEQNEPNSNTATNKSSSNLNGPNIEIPSFSESKPIGNMYQNCTFNVVLNRNRYSDSFLRDRTKRTRRTKPKPYDKVGKVYKKKNYNQDKDE